WVASEREHNRHGASRLHQGPYGRGAGSHYDVGRKRNQFRHVPANIVGISSGPAGIDPQVAADSPARFLHTLQERPDTGLRISIVGSGGQKHGDTPHRYRLLRARREWPRCCRSAEQRDELAPLHHSITSSAVESNVGGTARSSILAVSALMTSSNLLNCSTGR